MKTQMIKLGLMGLLLAAASSAFALNLQLGDIVQFDNTSEIHVDQGHLVAGVYYEVVGLQFTKEQLVQAKLEQYYDLLDKHSLAQIAYEPQEAVIVLQDVPMVEAVKGISYHSRLK